MRKLMPPAPTCPVKPDRLAAPLLDDKPTRIYVPLLMRSWNMRVCHVNVSYHLGVARTILLVDWHEHMHAVVVSFLSTTPGAKVFQTRWPIIFLPLPSGPGVAVSTDYFAALPVTPRGNCYILLFADKLSRRADMYAVSAAEFTAEGSAGILVNKYMPLWGCSVSLLSDSGLHFCTYVPSCHTLCTSFWACEKSQEAPIPPT